MAVNDHSQKPLALLERVLEASTTPGSLVLDPFCGSGTTGVAAIAGGRRFLGIDQQRDYIALAARRIRSAAPDAPLGEPESMRKPRTPTRRGLDA